MLPCLLQLCGRKYCKQETHVHVPMIHKAALRLSCFTGGTQLWCRHLFKTYDNCSDPWLFICRKHVLCGRQLLALRTQRQT
jgi:hypothetical protein